MSSVRYLREFVTQRLTAAAEEIFAAFEKTIVEYEEEIDRQRRLLDIVWKPQVKLHRIGELPQPHVCKEEEDVLSEQQLRNQERNSSLDQEEPEPPQVKEEQEELCTSQEGEQLVLKQETDDVTVTPADEESDHSEAEPSSEQQLLSPSSAVAESQDQEPSKHVHLESIRNAGPQPKKRCHQNTIDSNGRDSCPVSGVQCNTSTDNKLSECDFCENKFTSRFSLKEHLKIHTGEKPYVCDICGKGFSRTSTLNIHLRIHSGENLHMCNICGQRFNEWRQLKSHMAIHTDERPYLCKSCGDCFYQRSHLTNHMKIHARENMYVSKCMGEISDEVLN